MLHSDVPPSEIKTRLLYWLSNNDGRTTGPHELHEIRGMSARGELSPEAKLCVEGGSAWQPVSLLIGTPPTAPTTPADGVDGTFSGYGGFLKRFAAAIVDGFIGLVANFVVAFTFGMIMGLSGNADPEALELMGNFIAIAVQWLYSALMESSPLQATVGKMALGIKVTDLEGRRIGFGRATGRHFGKFVSAIVLFVGFIMVAFTARRQALHDIMADCLVVNRRSARQR
jgi:uncharacterized RDD family membrane protein YckC